MADPGGPVSPARPVWLGVVSLCLVQFADVLGVTVTVTALPAMLGRMALPPTGMTVGPGRVCALRVEEGLFDRVRGEGAGGGVSGRGFGGAAEAA
jgi:hypothetical protein